MDGSPSAPAPKRPERSTRSQQVIEEAGIYYQGRSKPVEEFAGQEFDLVVTVCDKAKESCPLWLKKVKRSISVLRTQPRLKAVRKKTIRLPLNLFAHARLHPAGSKEIRGLNQLYRMKKPLEWGVVF